MSRLAVPCNPPFPLFFPVIVVRYRIDKIRHVSLMLSSPLMDTNQIVAEMKAEIARLSQAVAVLTGGTPTKRRGRPPKSSVPDWVTSGAKPAPVEAPARKKRNFSPAQRKAAAERMRQMWAKKKKAAKKTAKG